MEYKTKGMAWGASASSEIRPSIDDAQCRECRRPWALRRWAWLDMGNMHKAKWLWFLYIFQLPHVSIDTTSINFIVAWFAQVSILVTVLAMATLIPMEGSKITAYFGASLAVLWISLLSGHMAPAWANRYLQAFSVERAVKISWASWELCSGCGYMQGAGVSQQSATSAPWHALAIIAVTLLDWNAMNSHWMWCHFAQKTRRRRRHRHICNSLAVSIVLQTNYYIDSTVPNQMWLLMTTATQQLPEDRLQFQQREIARYVIIQIQTDWRPGPMTEEERLADERDKALVSFEIQLPHAHHSFSMRFRHEDVWRMKLDWEMRNFSGRRMLSLDCRLRAWACICDY